MPAPATTQRHPFLMFRCSAVCAALPLSDVRETLRPLPIAAIEAAPAFVLGMSLVRGLATVVIDGNQVLDRSGVKFSAGPGTRFVCLRVPESPVALAVDAVLGIRDIELSALAALPPLVGAAEHGPIEQLARLDGDLWMLLRAARLIPDIADLELDVAVVA